jgi:hypothetical protein
MNALSLQLVDLDPSRADSEAATLNQSSKDLAEYPRFRQAYQAPVHPWQKDSVSKLIELVALPENWDGYGASPIGRDVAFFALEILQGSLGERTPKPSVVPTSVGGIQLEWHEKGIDLELQIIGIYECEMWFQDHQTGETNEQILKGDFAPLEGVLKKLTQR